MRSFRGFLTNEARLRKKTILDYGIGHPSTVRTQVMGWPVYFIDRHEHDSYKAHQMSSRVKLVRWLRDRFYDESDQLIEDAIKSVTPPPGLDRELEMVDRIKELNNDGWPYEFFVPTSYTDGMLDLKDLAKFHDGSILPEIRERLRESRDWAGIASEFLEGTMTRDRLASLLTDLIYRIIRYIAEKAYPGKQRMIRDIEETLHGNFHNTIEISSFDRETDIKSWLSLAEQGGGAIADRAVSLAVEKADRFLARVRNATVEVHWFRLTDNLNHYFMMALGALQGHLRDRFNREFDENFTDYTFRYAILDLPKVKIKSPFREGDIADMLLDSRHRMPSEVARDALYQGLYDSLDEIVSRGREYYKLYYDDEYEQKKFFNYFIESSLPVVQEVLKTLLSFGLRKLNKVPIVFSFQGWDEPSNYGTSMKVGHAGDDHIMIFGNRFSRGGLISVLAHEIGHIVFARLGHDEQQRLGELARMLKLTDYGDPGYVFPGLSEPTTGHTSGNEWFAELLAFWTLHANKLNTRYDVDVLKRDAPDSVTGLDHYPGTPEEMARFRGVQQVARKVFAAQAPLGSVRYKKPIRK